MASNRKRSKSSRGILSGGGVRPVAVFWDIENICAKRYQQNYGLRVHFFNQKMIGAVDNYCRNNDISRVISYVAMGHRPAKIYDLYGRAGYEFVFRDVGNGGKNSADILLIKKMAEVVKNYPEIRDYILITGDGDFTEPVRLLQELGVNVHLIYDPKWGSPDLRSECYQTKSVYEVMSDAKIEGDFVGVLTRRGQAQQEIPYDESYDETNFGMSR